MKAINSSHDFNILKSDGLVIGGYASIEMVDKQNDLITIDALQEAVVKYMDDPKFRNVMTNHSNVQVGEVIPNYRDKNGKLWKTEVDDVGFFVVIKMREDIEKAKEVNRDIRGGSLRSFSIGGQALEKRKKSHKEYGEYNEISKLELHEVTICEKGINPEAKFDILKQDKGSDVEKALQELNDVLEKINNSQEIEEIEKTEESVIKTVEKTDELTEVSKMPDEEMKEEYMDTSDMERAMHDKEDMTEKGMHDKEDMTEEKEEMEQKSTSDLATGHVEEGGAGRMDGGHDQLDSNFMAKYDGQSTLDLSAENLEKAYAQFKAEELEKMAFETVRNNFQSRLEAEMVAKSQEIEKSQYDAQAEVMELRKQFNDLLGSLKEEKATVIRKQQEVVQEINFPTGDEIAKMDWSEINALVERLEGTL